jgi:hypothetical protein
MRFSAVLSIVVLGAVLAGPLWAQGCFPAQGRQLAEEELFMVLGGETYVDVDADRTIAVVTAIPRDKYGMDYGRACTYTVQVHNRVTTRDQTGDGDFYTAASFPKGTANMSVRSIADAARQERYGSSSGEWIATDASRVVTAYPAGANGKADKSQPYTRQDYGYFWHANNAVPFKESVSAGCLISPKKDLDRVISTMKGDSGNKRISMR